MSQNAELQKVKERIRAFSQRTVANGCSESEAVMAMQKVGELLDTYNLTMNEVDVREATCVTKYFTTTTSHRGPMDNCAVALAAFVDCKIWFARRRGPNAKSRYAFFGHESDVEMALYLSEVIQNALAYEARAYKTTYAYVSSSNSREASRSFAIGMASRLGVRLTRMKAERDREVERREQEARTKECARREAAFAAQERAGDGSSVASGIDRASQHDLGSIGSLIILKGQIVERELKKAGVRLVSSRSSRRPARDDTARKQGAAAGDRVNLSRPVGGGSTISGLIGG